MATFSCAPPPQKVVDASPVPRPRLQYIPKVCGTTLLQICLPWWDVWPWWVAHVCFIHKVMHGLAPPPLSGLINFKSTANKATWGVAREDCSIPLSKTAFSLAVFSFRLSHQRTSGLQSIVPLSNQWPELARGYLTCAQAFFCQFKPSRSTQVNPWSWQLRYDLGHNLGDIMEVPRL